MTASIGKGEFVRIWINTFVLRQRHASKCCQNFYLCGIIFWLWLDIFDFYAWKNFVILKLWAGRKLKKSNIFVTWLYIFLVSFGPWGEKKMDVRWETGMVWIGQFIYIKNVKMKLGYVSWAWNAFQLELGRAAELK